MSAAVEDFAAGLVFPLDDFQEQGCEAIAAGHGVLVAAPTGAGKTVVGEFAVHLALQRGQKAFYTTPIKALSNQKYHELAARYGHDKVGLLTGDSSINGEAPVVVMTTEVLRNMIYAGSSTLEQLGFVVMDEVHYLADRFRGAVWEEVIIHLPPSVQLVSLSATVSNAEEFGAWLAEVRGGNEIVVSETRPVPLWQHMQVGQEIYDLFVDGATPDALQDRVRVNPHLMDAVRRQVRSTEEVAGQGRGRGGPRDRRGGGRRGGTERFGGGASRTQVITQLDREGLLPAITFIFSRVGCEGAVGQLLGNDVRLISAAEGERNRRTLEERSMILEGEDLTVLGYHQLLAGLERGYAPHHAGMLPIFREVVEELFTAGRLKAVFATETLALGINMPARTVVLEKLVKFNGEAHVEVTPAEYTQLTGRAGRRGIDIEGHAVVVWSRGMDPLSVAGLASTRTYPLRSSFAPTYNMAVNLVATVGRTTAREILESSFAQFQADRAVVGLAQKVRSMQESLDGYAEAMHCEQGDFREYAEIRHKISELEKKGRKQRSAARRAQTAVSLDELELGDIVRIGGRRSGLAVVVQPAKSYKGQTSEPVVLTEHKQVRRLSPGDLDGPLTPFGRLEVPRSFNPRSAKHRTDLATTLRIKAPHEGAPSIREEAKEAAAGDDGRIAQLRDQLKAHPCHACPDREEHARWSERWWRLKREQTQLQRTVDSRTGSVAARFDRIVAVLLDLGYLADEGDTITDEGSRLRRLYSDKDLLAAECLRAGTWKRLTPAELAAVVSMLVYEPRRDEVDVMPRIPTDEVALAWEGMQERWREIEAREERAGLDPTGYPDAGIAWAVHRWASGRRLDEVLDGTEMTAGDFVRRCKQIVDLLDQVAKASGEERMRTTARKAIEGVMRGVVAADRID